MSSGISEIQVPIQINGQNEIFTFITIPIDVNFSHDADIATFATLATMGAMDPLSLATEGGSLKMPLMGKSNIATEQVLEKPHETESVIKLHTNEQTSTSSNFIEPNVGETLNTDTVQNLATFEPFPEVPKSFTCNFCDQSFSNIVTYKQHLVAVHRNDKKFKCNVCSANYNIEDNYKIHVALHHAKETVCPLCQRIFKRSASFKSHIVLHQVEETFSCSQCLAEFDKEHDFIKHIARHTLDFLKSSSSTEFICNVCHHSFDDKTKYREHIANHVKMKKFVLSDKKSVKVDRLNKYQKHTCNICNKTFAKYCILERHMRIHSGEKPFVCHICNSAFTQKGTLQIHLRKHAGVKPFHCSLCPAKFCQKSNLRIHVEKTHTAPAPGEKYYKCHMCTCIFKKVSSLNSHITKLHPLDKKSNEDDVMAKLKDLEKQLAGRNIQTTSAEDTFPNNLLNPIAPEVDKTVNEAVKTVTLVDTSVEGTIKRYSVRRKRVAECNYYLCLYCPKEFKKPSDLIRHLRMHTKEKPFKCKQCNQAFALKSTLNFHENTHVKKRYVQCMTCLKMFTSVRSLNYHIRKHDGNAAKSGQNYVCSMCNKKFNSFARAEFHVQTHAINNPVAESKETQDENVALMDPLLLTNSGLVALAPPVEDAQKKMFRCGVCEMSFSRLYTLKTHVLVHMGERKFKCDKCAKTYLTKSTLKEHMKLHDVENTVVCHICDRPFRSKKMLNRHIGTHTTKKTFVCPYCQKAFRTLGICRKHITLHKNSAKHMKPGLIIDMNNDRVSPPPPTLDLHAAFSDNPFADISESFNINPDSNLHVNDKLVDSLTNCAPPNNLPDTSLLLTEPVATLNQDNGQLFSNLNSQLFLDGQKLSNTTDKSKGDYLNCDYSTFNATYNNAWMPSKTNDFILNHSGDLPDSGLLLANDANLLGDTQLDPQLLESILPTLTNTSAILNDASMNANVMLANTELSQTNLQEVEATGAFFTSNAAADLANDVTANFTNLIYPNALTGNIAELNEANPQTPLTQLTLETNPCIAESSKKCGSVLKNATELNEHSCKKPSANKRKAKKKKTNVKRKMGKKSPQTKQDTSANSSENSQKSTENDFIEVSEVISKVCQYCQRIFRKRSDMIRHIRTHTGEKPYNCGLCSKSFSLKSTLKLHMNTHNPGSNKSFVCSVCSAHFASKSSLRVHCYKHTGAEPYLCPLCPATFRTSGKRKTHVLKHKNGTIGNESLLNVDAIWLKPIKVGSATIQALPQNLLAQNDPAYEAIQIDSTLLQQLQLGNVLLDDTSLVLDFNGTTSKPITNELLKRFECEVCGKKYTRKSILTKHIKNAHGEKPHQCTRCGEAFPTIERCESHMKSHDGHPCPICFNTFKLEKHLKIHMKRIHPNCV